MKNIIRIVVLCFLFISTGMQVFAATMQEDKVSILGNIDVDKPIRGSVVAIFGSVNARYAVDGDIVAVLGSVNVESDVRGDVVAVLGKVTLGSQANVAGDVVAIGPGGIQRLPGSEIGGDSVGINFGNLDLPRFKINFPPFMYRGFGFFNFFSNVGFFIFLVFSLLIITIAGERVKNISESVEDNIIRKLIIGTVLFFCFPIIAILLAITIIGLPIAIVFFGIALLLGFAAFCAYIGRKVLELLNSTANIYGEFAVGAIVFAITMTTVHPSWWIGAALAIISLGLAFDTVFGKKVNGVKS
jgi:hypothetical protein